jgi:hypothetical protein
VIGTSGSAGSACDLGFPSGAQENCAGITMSRNGTNNFAVTVTNNTIQQFGQNGITLNADLSGTLNAKLGTNTIRQAYFNVGTAHAAGNAIQSNIGTSSAAGLNACVDIISNIIDGGDATFGWDPNNQAAAIYTRARNSANVSIPGYAGGDVPASVQTFIAGANTMTAPAAGIKVKADSATGTFVNGSGACSTP